jgi:O-antigen ligase
VTSVAVAAGESHSRITPYVLVCIPVLAYFVSVALKLEFAYLHIVLGLGIFILACVNFDLAFLFVPLALTNPYPVIENGFNLTFSEFVMLIIFLVWFGKMLTGDIPTIFPRMFLVPALLIVAAAILSIAAARFLVPAVLQVIRYVEILIFLFILVVNRFRDEASIRRVAFSLWIGGLIACVVGLIMFILGVVEENEAGRLLLWHGGGFGALVAVTLWFSLAILLYDNNTGPRLLALVGIPLASVVLILSETRSWIAAFVLVTLLVFLLQRKKGSAKVLLSFLGLVIVMVLFVQTSGFGLVDKAVIDNVMSRAFRFGLRAGEYSVLDLSLLMRFNVWWHGILYFLSNPLTGIGAGNLRFDDYFTGHLAYPTATSGYVDNQYIQFFAETGIIGGVAWIVYIFKGISVGRSAVLATANKRSYVIAIGLFGFVLILAVGSVFWVITPHHELFGILVVAVALLHNIFRLGTDET